MVKEYQVQYTSTGTPLWVTQPLVTITRMIIICPAPRRYLWPGATAFLPLYSTVRGCTVQCAGGCTVQPVVSPPPMVAAVAKPGTLHSQFDKAYTHEISRYMRFVHSNSGIKWSWSSAYCTMWGHWHGTDCVIHGPHMGNSLPVPWFSSRMSHITCVDSDM